MPTLSDIDSTTDVKIKNQYAKIFVKRKKFGGLRTEDQGLMTEN